MIVTVQLLPSHTACPLVTDSVVVVPDVVLVVLEALTAPAAEPEDDEPKHPVTPLTVPQAPEHVEGDPLTGVMLDAVT